MPLIITSIDAATREAMNALDTIDGHCLDVCAHVAERVPGARLRRYDRVPHHDGPHFTVVARNREFDPTVGFANWSRGLRGVPRGRVYTVGPKSPHRRWR